MRNSRSNFYGAIWFLHIKVGEYCKWRFSHRTKLYQLIPQKSAGHTGKFKEIHSFYLNCESDPTCHSAGECFSLLPCSSALFHYTPLSTASHPTTTKWNVPPHVQAPLFSIAFHSLQSNNGNVKLRKTVNTNVFGGWVIIFRSWKGGVLQLLHDEVHLLEWKI